MTPEQVEQIRAKKTERAQRKADKFLKWAEIAQKKAEQLQEEIHKEREVIPLGQPILTGHHSEKGHRSHLNRLNNKDWKAFELKEKAKKHREKAENIMRFKTRVKGDAEREREKEREGKSLELIEGTRVRDNLYGNGTIIKANEKTCRIDFDGKGTLTRDKTFLEVINKEKPKFWKVS